MEKEMKKTFFSGGYVCSRGGVWSQGVSAPRGVCSRGCLVLGGVWSQGVCSRGVWSWGCLLWGECLLWSWGGVSAQGGVWSGGVSAPGVSTLGRGCLVPRGCLILGVSAPGVSALGGVCSGGCLLLGGVCSWGVWYPSMH